VTEGAKGERRRAGEEHGSPLDLEAPHELLAHRFDVGADSFAVLEFPVTDVVAPALLARLSASEQSVFRLILEGKSNLEIARARPRAVRTVANQVASIFRKLGIGSRHELYALAARGTPVRE